MRPIFPSKRRPLIRRLARVVLTGAVLTGAASASHAADAPADLASASPDLLQSVIVTAKAVGSAESASAGVVGGVELSQRPNGVVKYSKGDAVSGGGLTFQAYDARWTASDQIPVRAIPFLDGGRYGSVDPTSTGHTYRYSLAAERHWGGGQVSYQVEAYALRYGLNLYSDFSGFVDQTHGDQFRQYDNRTVLGAFGKATVAGNYLGLKTSDAFGLQTRDDFVNLELDHTEARRVLQVYRTDQVAIQSLSA